MISINKLSLESNGWIPSLAIKEVLDFHSCIIRDFGAAEKSRLLGFKRMPENSSLISVRLRTFKNGSLQVEVITGRFIHAWHETFFLVTKEGRNGDYIKISDFISWDYAKEKIDV